MAAMIRPVGFGLIAAAAVAVWVLMAPPEVVNPSFDLSVQAYANLVTQALDDAEANEAIADSAPQQQVVNGWVARDLLSIIALQNTDLLEGIGLLGEQNSSLARSLPTRDDRVPALIGLTLLAICWHGALGRRELASRISSLPSMGAGSATEF